MSKPETAFEEDAKWLDVKTKATMRNELWCTLRTYIDLGKLARMAELERWRNFAREIGEDGALRFSNAEEHVAFLERQERLLEEIMTYTDAQVRERIPGKEQG